MFRNKQDKYEVVTRNKTRLVAIGYVQVMCLDFEETFALITILESIRILLVYDTHHCFKLYQMGIKRICNLFEFELVNIGMKLSFVVSL